MNWGNRIALAFTFFAAFIMYMVVTAFNQDFDLVAEDYYAREINYQNQLEQQANLQTLGEQVEIVQEGGKVLFRFPESVKPEKGEVYFYHPSKKLLDKKFEVESRELLVSSSLLVAGNYHLNISWTADGKEYFQKDKIYIP